MISLGNNKLENIDRPCEGVVEGVVTTETPGGWDALGVVAFTKRQRIVPQMGHSRDSQQNKSWERQPLEA